MKTTLLKNLSMILFLAALAACSGPPSVEEIKGQLESAVLGDAGGIATVANFEKTNGHEKDENTYIADVKYDLVFSNDAQGMLQQAIKESPPAALAARGSEGLALAAFGPVIMDLVAGQTFSIQDQVTFIETEKGWVLKEWHPEALGKAMGESLLEKMATALSSTREPAAGSVAQGDPKLATRSEGSEHTKVEPQQALANQEAEMERVMEENAGLQAENEEAKRRLEEQQASPQPASAAAASASVPPQTEGAPAITPGRVPNLRQAADSRNSVANPFVAEMITAALANDNQRIIELRDQLLSQPKPQRGDRKRARALNDEGLSYLNAREPAKAVASFQLATQMDRGDIEIINNLGFALMKAGRLAESEQALTKTLLVAPDRTSAWANLGNAYAMAGKKREAVGCFTNAYRFSQNAEKTKNFFANLSQRGENQTVRQAAAEALQAM